MDFVTINPTPSESPNQALKEKKKRKLWPIVVAIGFLSALVATAVITLCIVLLKTKPNYITVKPKLNVGAKLNCTTTISMQFLNVSDDFQLNVYPIAYGSDHTVFLGLFVENDTTVTIKFSQKWVNGTISPDVCVSEATTQQELEIVRGLLSVLNCSTCNNRVTNEEILTPATVTENARLAPSDLLDSYSVDAEIGSTSNSSNESFGINIPKMEIRASCSNVGAWFPSEEWVAKSIDGLRRCVLIAPKPSLPKPSSKLQPTESLIKRITLPTSEPLKLGGNSFALYAQASYTGATSDTVTFAAELGYELNSSPIPIQQYTISRRFDSLLSVRKEYQNKATLFTVPIPVSIATLYVSVSLGIDVSVDLVLGLGALTQSSTEYIPRVVFRGQLVTYLDAYASVIVASAGVQGTGTFRTGLSVGGNIVLPRPNGFPSLKCSWNQYEVAPLRLDVKAFVTVGFRSFGKTYEQTLWKKDFRSFVGGSLMHGYCPIPSPPSPFSP